MSRLIFGETAERVSEHQIVINSGAACEIVFTRRKNSTIGHFMSDRRNPVNVNTVKRWKAFVTSEFKQSKEKELAFA